MRIIDGHVHIIGDGSSGSGCWYRPHSIWSKFLEYKLAQQFKMPRSSIRGCLDECYVSHLVELVRASSLDAILILAMEIPYDDNGNPLDAGAVFVPNDYVLKLARKYPEFIPAVAIHPARADALDELDRCLAAGSRVLKLLPNCQNINCSDPRFKPFWDRLAENGMVLLSHTGGELTLPVINAAYADPLTLKLPLECGVNVIAAHCAGRSCLNDPDYTDQLLKMFPLYPNLYGDNSALNSPVRSRALHKILKPPVVDRILHGSDYPIPVNGLGPFLRGHLPISEWLRWQRHTNVLERDYQLKRAMGFPEETFTRLDRLLTAA